MAPTETTSKRPPPTSIRLSPAELERIDQAATEYAVTRGELMRACLRMGLRRTDLLERELGPL